MRWIQFARIRTPGVMEALVTLLQDPHNGRGREEEECAPCSGLRTPLRCSADFWVTISPPAGEEGSKLQPSSEGNGE